MILGISRSTAQRLLERIYVKLRVETRTAGDHTDASKKLVESTILRFVAELAFDALNKCRT